MPIVPASSAHSLCTRPTFSRLPKNTSVHSRVVPHVASGFSTGFARRGDRTFDSDSYFGEDAPNTGFRQRPPAELGWQPRSVAQFQQRTTAECYSSFPGEVKSSCPMYLAIPVPEEVEAIFAADPSTGSRHRPDPTELNNKDGSEDVSRNLRWLEARRAF